MFPVQRSLRTHMPPIIASTSMPHSPHVGIMSHARPIPGYTHLLRCGPYKPLIRNVSSSEDTVLSIPLFLLYALSSPEWSSILSSQNYMSMLGSPTDVLHNIGRDGCAPALYGATLSVRFNNRIPFHIVSVLFISCYAAVRLICTTNFKSYCLLPAALTLVLGYLPRSYYAMPSSCAQARAASTCRMSSKGTP